MQLNRLDQGEQYLQTLKSRGEREDDVSYFLGRLAELRQEPEQAQRFYRLVQQGNNYPEARTRLALLQAKAGMVDEAIAEVQALRERLPSRAKRLYIIEASILANAKREKEAFSVYRRAMKEFPGDYDLLYARAMFSEEVDRLDQLEADLRAIIEKDPDNINALNSLGYTLADRTDRYQEAYELIKRAYELDKNSNAILDSLGWVLYKLGRLDEALPLLKRSIKLKKDHEVAAHLGEVLWVSGQKDAALEVWNDALQSFPDDTLIKKVMRQFVPESGH